MATKSIVTPGSGILKRHEKLLDTIRHGTENEAIALFSEEGYDVNTKVDYTFDDRKKYVVTPLAWAVRYKRPLLCRYLLRNGADPYSNLVFDYYPLHEACNRGYDEIVKIFITMKCDINRITSDHHSPLHIACMRGNIECARLLLEAGANREVRNDNGHTPLELGIYHGQTDLYRLFSYYCDDSKPKIQRRHSLHSPTGEPRHPVKQIVSMDSSFSFSPHSMLDRPSSTSAKGEVSASAEDVSWRHSASNINRCKSLSNQNLSSYGFSFAAQPHTCSGSVAPTTTQLQVTPAQISSNLSLSPSGRPNLIKQFSQASPCSADSPSPVEKDGVLPNSSSYKSSGLAKKATSVEVQEVDSATIKEDSNAAPKSSKCRRPLKDKHHLDTSLPNSGPVRSKLGPNHCHSNPEFPLVTQTSVVHAERTHSFDDLYKNRRKPPFQAQTERVEVTPSREKINSLSSQLYSSLERQYGTTLSSGAYHQILKEGTFTSESPVGEIMQKIIKVTTPLLNINQAHMKTLTELSGACNTQQFSGSRSCMSFPSYTPSNCSEEETVYDSPVTHLLSLGYKLSDKPLSVMFAVPSRGYMTLTFELTHQSLEEKGILLKVITKIFDLKDKYQSSTYHHSMDEGLFGPETPSPHLLEISLLTHLSQSPHPNIAQLLTSFKANTNEQHELFAQQMNPDNPKKMYTTARTADFIILKSPKVSLKQHLEVLRRTGKALKMSDVFPETMVLSMLSQVLLAVGHLVRHQVAHCAVSLCNLFTNEGNSGRIVLANFSHAIQLNSQRQNLERVHQVTAKLKAEMDKDLKKDCMLSPEVLKAVENSEIEKTFLQGELNKLFAKNDTFSAAWMIYNWFLSGSHSFMQRDWLKPYAYNDIPYLSQFSPHCNHLLKKLVAYDCNERLSPMEGVMACFVLMFGPNISNINTEDECYTWLLAETVEFYMRPVLVDSKARDYTDSFSKLLCVYLTVASSNPRGVWDACRFFRKCQSL